MKMEKNEIRAFKIRGQAITELLWELLNDVGDEFLDIQDDMENVYSMNWNKEDDELVFYALELGNPRQIDFERIDKYIEKNIDVTTSSLYDGSQPRYVSFNFDDVN